MHDDARKLLERAVNVYASMTSYSDVGCVTQHLQPHEPLLRTEFSTLYARPNLFRFEFSSRHPSPHLQHMVTRHVVGSDGFGAYALRRQHEAPPLFQARQDLTQAVSGVAGVSSGAAHNIARLLLQEVDGLSILDLIDARRADDQVIDDAACHCICALLPKGGERTLWFERGSLLLRRIRTSRGNMSLDELHRAIRVNAPLDDALFDIEAPDFSLMQAQYPHSNKYS